MAGSPPGSSRPAANLAPEAAISAMRSRAFDRAYRRLGPRYPRAAVLAQLQVGYVVWLVGVVTLALYLDMGLGEFLRLLAVAEAAAVADVYLATRFSLSRIEPSVTWLRGSRDPEAATAAWRAAATLPVQLLRWRPIYGVAAVTALAFGAYATWELGLPRYAAVILFSGSCLVYLYWVVLRFLGIELVLRPVLRDLGELLPQDAELPRMTIPLRRRLIAALPAVTVISGAIIPALASGGGVRGLALGMLAAAGVALAIAVPVIGMVSDSVAAPIAELEEGTRRVGGGDLETKVPVFSTDETGELARSFNRMVAGLVERERIREAFGTYLDREVADHILRAGTDLAGAEVEVTVMFLDVRDFTGFAERVSAPEVVSTLNRLFELVVPIIHEHGGHVDKFVGDGLLAVFGAPRRQEDHADQALAAALEIAAAVDQELDRQLEVGLGLNSGRVVAGNVGGGGRLEFSVIGDVVNVAARVEAATRLTGDVILVSEHTRRLLKAGRAQLEERPQVPLKGKRRPVMLYAPRPAPRRAPARGT
jgi:adenylate cyclase